MKEGFNRRSSYLGENSFPHSQQGGCGPLSEAASPSLPPPWLQRRGGRGRASVSTDRRSFSLFSLLCSSSLTRSERRRGRWQATKQPGERGRTDGPPSTQLSLLVLVLEIGPAAHSRRSWALQRLWPARKPPPRRRFPCVLCARALSLSLSLYFTFVSFVRRGRVASRGRGGCRSA